MPETCLSAVPHSRVSPVEPELRGQRPLPIEGMQTDRIPAAVQSEITAAAPDPDPGENKPSQSLVWRRKAVKRRLQKCQPTGQENIPYSPQFTTPRPQEPAPVFEQTPDELAGQFVGKRGEDASRREKSIMFTGVIFTALLGTSAAAIMLRESEGADSPSAILARGEANEMALIHHHAAQLPEASGVLRDFLRATTAEEKARFVRGGASMLPALRSYYARHSDEPPGFHSAANTGFADYEGREFFFVHGTTDARRNIETLVEDTPAGLKLDWRFLTGAGDMEWSDWINSHPQHEVAMRVEATLDDYFAGPFSDSREWLCLKMTDAAHTATVWAYVPRGSNEGVTLRRQLKGKTGHVRLLGTFTFPDPLPPGNRFAPQVRLTGVATQGWLDRSPEAAGLVSTAQISSSNRTTTNQ
jgi:hypothetical protein